jgi:hypothetical protein
MTPTDIESLIASDHKRGCQGRTYTCATILDGAQ